MCTKAWNLCSKPWNIKFSEEKKLFPLGSETFLPKFFKKRNDLCFKIMYRNPKVRQDRFTASFMMFSIGVYAQHEAGSLNFSAKSRLLTPEIAFSNLR